MLETLNRDLVDEHLFSFINVGSNGEAGDAQRWYWSLSEMAGTPAQSQDTEFAFRYKSREAAVNYAFGWIRRNRPELRRAATQEARDGIRYRATKV